MGRETSLDTHILRQRSFIHRAMLVYSLIMDKKWHYGGVLAVLALAVNCAPLPPETEMLGIERFLEAHPVPPSPSLHDRTARWGVKYPPRTTSGHNWITKKAFEHLRKRNLLPPELDSEEQMLMVQYGVTFADEPWLGRPEAPYDIVVNHMTKEIETYAIPEYEPTGPGQEPRRIREKMTYERCAIPFAGMHGQTSTSKKIVNTYHNLDLESRIWVEWTEGCEDTEKPNVTPYFMVRVRIDGTEFKGLPETALDNMFHFSYQDLDLLGVNPSQESYDLRILVNKDDVIGPVNAGMPLYVKPLMISVELVAFFGSLGFYDMDIVEDIAKDLVGAVNGTRILEGPPFGSVTYGAILYQLSRKFFTGSGAEPVLSELIPARSTGTVRWEAPYKGPMSSFPTTYLGGMPFICAPPLDSANQGSDPCAAGRPTWPIWVPESYSEADTKAFLLSLLAERPGRSDRVAAIYLGWAAHMIQDGALPYHVANWQGIEHVRQESFDGLGYRPRTDASPSNTIYVGTSIANMTKVVLCKGEATRVNIGLPPIIPTIPPTIPLGWSPTPDCHDPYFVTMDEYIDAEVTRRFGTMNRQEICANANITDDQLQAGRLNQEAVIPVFARGARRAHDARYSYPPHGLERVRDSIVSTMELLMCAPPQAPVIPPASECAEGVLQCFGNQAQKCVGQKWVNTPTCIEANPLSYCTNGKCIDRQCTEGYRCIGDDASECIDGKWKHSAICSSSGGVCSHGACVFDDSHCMEGEFMCVGDAAKQCNQGQWKASRTCSIGGGHCDAGECVEPGSCAEGDTRCAGNYREICRSGAWFRSKCQGSQHCIETGGVAECQ